MRRRGALALSLEMLTACSGPSMDDDVNAAIADTLAYWDAEVGYRAPVDINKNNTVGYSQGHLILGATWWPCAAITLYVRAIERFDRDDVYSCTRRVLTHELGHVHLACSDEDHSLGGIMGPTEGECSYAIESHILEELRK